MNAQKILLGIGLVAISLSGKTQTWNQVTVPTQEKLNDIQFTDDLNGFIVGENGTFLRTTNGGTVWDQPAIQGIPNQSTANIKDIEMIDALTGFLSIENNSSIYQTIDGGLNWTQVLNNGTNQCFPISIYANSTDDFFVGGADCFQGATINQVLTGNWSNQTINYETFNTLHYVIDFDFDGSLGLAVINNEFILRSTDTGVTWDTINSNIGNGNELTSVFIASNDTCYAGYNQGGSGFGILYSADNGVTWQEDINSATFFYPAYYGATENNLGNVYMAAVPSFGQQGLIFEKQGAFWNYFDVDQPVYAMDSYGDDVTWAVGDSGYVLVNQDLSTVSVEEMQFEMQLLTAYPNPASDQLSWECNECTATEIRVLDVSGKQVLEASNPMQNSISVLSLHSGVYIFEIHSDLGIHSTRFVKE